MLLSILSFALVFVIVALAHELGHFIWSKRVGIRVLELGIGLGPTLFKFQRNGTIYSINLLPAFAFVRLAGIDEENEEEKNACPDNEKYFSKTPFQKFQSIAAGPIMNLILGFFIFTYMANIYGLPQLSPEISTVSHGSVAEKIGLRPGDKIISADGKNNPDLAGLIQQIHKNPGKTIDIGVSRNEKHLIFSAVPEYNKTYKAGLIGFSLKAEYIKYDFMSSFRAGGERTILIISGILNILGQLLTGKVAISDLAGPVGIAQFSGQAASQGFAAFLSFIGLISINLGVFNLLPIPALDGGRLVFVLIEAIRDKPIKIEVENKIHQWGLIFLLIFIAIVSVNDVIRIISSKFTK